MYWTFKKKNLNVLKRLPYLQSFQIYGDLSYYQSDLSKTLSKLCLNR